MLSSVLQPALDVITCINVAGWAKMAINFAMLSANCRNIRGYKRVDFFKEVFSSSDSLFFNLHFMNLPF